MLTPEMATGLITVVGVPHRLDVDLPAKFKVGDRVRARDINPPHHTRIPRYVRGKAGVITADHGVFALPDNLAQAKFEEPPQRAYAVKFEATELWGDEANAGDTLFIDLYDGYLEQA